MLIPSRLCRVRQIRWTWRLRLQTSWSYPLVIVSPTLRLAGWTSDLGILGATVVRCSLIVNYKVGVLFLLSVPEDSRIFRCPTCVGPQFISFKVCKRLRLFWQIFQRCRLVLRSPLMECLPHFLVDTFDKESLTHLLGADRSASGCLGTDLLRMVRSRFILFPKGLNVSVNCINIVAHLVLSLKGSWKSRNLTLDTLPVLWRSLLVSGHVPWWSITWGHWGIVWITTSLPSHG